MGCKSDSSHTNNKTQYTYRKDSLTCEVFQAQLAQAKVSITSVVEEDCKRVAVLIQLGSSDDPQVLQWQIVKLVQSHQHIACHFSDRLWTDLLREVLEYVLHV